MATLKLTLSDPLYTNWVKAGLSLRFTRDGIEEFVKRGVNKFHQDVLNKVWHAPKVLCQSCTTANVTTRGWKCPNGICDEIRKEIVNRHRFKPPSWKNSDARQWGTNPWELAKCFMAPMGYSAVSSAAETDFPGLVNVVINLTDFQNVVTDNLSLPTNIFCQARTKRNMILHSPSFKITDPEFTDIINNMIQILSDGKSLVVDPSAIDAIAKLSQIKSGSLTMSEEDETKLRAEAIKAIEQKRQEAVKHIQKEGKEQSEQIGIEGQNVVVSIETKSKEEREHIDKVGQKAVMSVEAKSKEERKYIDKEKQKGVKRVIEEGNTQSEVLNKKRRQTIMSVEAKSKEERKHIGKVGQKAVMSVEAKSKEERKYIDKEGQKGVKRISKEGKKQSEVLNKKRRQTIMSVETKSKEERKHIDKEGQKGVKRISKEGKKQSEVFSKKRQQTIMSVETKSKEERKLIDKEGQKGVKRISKEGKKQSEVLNKKRRQTIMSVETKSKEERKHIDKEGQKGVKRISKEGKKQSEVLNKKRGQTIMSLETKSKEEKKLIDKEGQKGVKRISKEGKKQSEMLNKKRRQTIMSVETKSKKERKHIEKEGQKGVKRISKEGKKQSEVLSKKRQQTIMSVETKSKEERKHIDKEGQKVVTAIKAKGKEQIEQIEKERRQTEDKAKQTYLRDKKDLQRQLIEVYRDNALTVPVYPLSSDEDDAKIADLYVTPCMELVDPRQKSNEKKESITSYHKIFHKDSHLCKKIYITGDAGMGKSTLCQKMVDSWCTTHSTQETHGRLTEHEHTMSKFDFLFYIPLRNALSYSNVEEMITNLVPAKHQVLLSRVLEDDSVQSLIILDGLDEWTQPKDKPLKHSQMSLFDVSTGLPARKVTNNCSILTTSRPWKLEVFRIRNSEIDRQIKLTGIDDDSSKEFIKSVVNILNEHSNTGTMSAEEFARELKEKRLDQFRHIPVMLKQLICLWHDGRPLGETQCDVYSGMMDLLFELAEKRLADNQDFIRVKEEQTNSQRKLPHCFDKKTKWVQFSGLLYSLSKMAFETLFSTNRESSLVFDSSVAEMYGLSHTEIEICLKVGILSQSKFVKGCTSRLKSLSFLHKSFQEFLAALYVSMSTDSIDTHLQQIFSICGTLDICLEMEKILVFISGLLPQYAFRLSGHICVVASRDSRVQWYRRNVSFAMYDFYSEPLIHHIQSAILNCVRESSNPKLKIEDIFITEDDEAPPEALINTNITNIKSLELDMSVLTRSLQTPVLEASVLQKLVIECNSETTVDYDFISHMLTKSQNTLKSLVLTSKSLNQLQYPKQQFSTMLGSLCQLEAIHLEYITLPHDEIEWLMSFLSQRTQMRQIGLSSVHCSDHYSRYCRYQLDLSQLTQLQALTLEFLFVEKVQVNTTDLERCETSYLHQPGASASVLRCLQGTPKLQHLQCQGFEHPVDIDTLVTTVPTLVHLQSITLLAIDFGKRQLQLSPEMRDLETVGLLIVAMTSEAWRCFIDSIPNTQKSVGVYLSNGSARAISAIQDYVRSSSRFVLNEDSGSDDNVTFQTTVNKDEC